MTMVVEDISTRIYTVDKYPELELTSEFKHEFVDRILIEMPGESGKANETAGNTQFALRTRVKGKKPFSLLG